MTLMGLRAVRMQKEAGRKENEAMTFTLNNRKAGIKCYL